MVTEFHPDLTKARFLPRTTALPRNLRVLRFLTGLSTRSWDKGVEIVPLSNSVSVRVWRPRSRTNPSSALLWIHGGGMVMGSAAQDNRFCRRLSEELDIFVGSVEYRLAPEHPFPAPLEDCYEALLWIVAQPGVDPTHIAIGGASAGGGLAAALALLAKERGQIRPVAQSLAYPMLDDRTIDRTDIDPRRLRMWNRRSNRFGWEAYLGTTCRDHVPPLAAPSRYEDLSGLPPAWIGVGTNDLFHDEDVAYAQRLRAAGVPCELTVVSGAYHGFDLIESKTAVAKGFIRAQTLFLQRALSGEATGNL